MLIPHTSWGAMSPEQRYHYRPKLAHIGKQVAERFRLSHATSNLLYEMRDSIRGECENRLAGSGWPVPPFWVGVEMEDDRAQVTLHLPEYQHDCDECLYLGNFNDHDLYRCRRGMVPTFVARFGSEQQMYKKGAQFVRLDPEINEACRRNGGPP